MHRSATKNISRFDTFKSLKRIRYTRNGYEKTGTNSVENKIDIKELGSAWQESGLDPARVQHRDRKLQTK